MYSKAKIAGHPIHPMIVAFPITFYTTTFIAFAIYAFVRPDPFVYRLAYVCNFAGVATALLAAIPGFIDWAFGIPKATPAKARGLLHMALNVSALILFAISALQIRGSWDTPPASVMGPFLLSLFGVGLTLAAGYHGWELIARHKVGVDMTPEQERLERSREEKRQDMGVPGRPRTV